MNEPNVLPPEPRYGWVMVALAPLFIGFAIGSMGAISVFIKPLGTEFGWLRGETSLSYLLSMAAVGVGGLLMGHLADRYHSRRIVLGGAAVLGLSFLAMARQDSLWEFYLYSCLSSGLGSAAFFAPLLANVGGWFNRNKGLAIGITTAGQALGQGIVPYVASFLIASLGWRGAYNAMGLFALLGLLPLSLLIRNPPARKAQSTGPAAGGGEAFAVPPPISVGVLSFAAIFCCITMATPMVHVVALASDRGLGPTAAAGVLLAIMVSGFFGRIFFGKLSDWIGGLRGYLLASAWQTALVFGFTLLHSPGAFYALAVLFGFGYAGVMTCLLLCAQGFAPASRSGIATAVVSLFGFIGMGTGGFQAGFFFDVTGDYTQSFANAAFAGMINLLILSSLYFYHTRRVSALRLATRPA
jgi:MFS family permease